MGDFLVNDEAYCGEKGCYFIGMNGRSISGEDKVPDPLIVEYNNPNVGIIKYAVLLKKDFKTKMIRRMDELVFETFTEPEKIDAVSYIACDGSKHYELEHINGDLLDDAWWNLRAKMFIERWKPVTYPDVEVGTYEISNLGNIRNVRDGVMVPSHFNCDYKRADLRTEDKSTIRRKCFYVHCLVAREFICKSFPDNGLIVNHIDGNKSNNRYDNLELITQQENVRHSWLFGLNTPNSGENNGSHVLSQKDVELICKLLVIHNGNIQHTRQHLVDYGIVLPYEDRMLNQIKYGKNWKEISQNYFKYCRNGRFMPVISKEDIEI